jgi:hypothetical protein
MVRIAMVRIAIFKTKILRGTKNESLDNITHYIGKLFQK